jgi:hypothetical protein
MKHISLRKIVRKQKADEQRRKELDSQNGITIYTSLKDEKWWIDFFNGKIKI